jgi:Tfp pilus assembly protein PilV
MKRMTTHRPFAAGFLHRSKRGFALVITLSLMVLLTLLAVGLLTLSGVSLRTSAQSEAQWRRHAPSWCERARWVSSALPWCRSYFVTR